MSDRLTALCDLGFLEAFYMAEPAGKRAAEYTDADRTWQDVHRFLTHDADVVLDLPDDRAVLDDHPFLRDLFGFVGAGDLRLDSSAFQGVGTAAYHRDPADVLRLYLLERDGLDPADATRRTRAFFADSESILDDWPALARPRLVPVGRSEVEGSIDDLSGVAGLWPPVGAVVVADRYLFADEHGVLDNLVPFLLALLPTEPHEVRVDVLLLGKKDASGAWREDPSWIRSSIVEILEKHRPFLNLDLTVSLAVRWPPELHDRRVFLSYLYVQSGISINQYVRRGRANTPSRLTPSSLTDPAVLGTFRSELAEIKRVVEEGPAHTAGSKRNKLFGPAE